MLLHDSLPVPSPQSGEASGCTGYSGIIGRQDDERGADAQLAKRSRSARIWNVIGTMGETEYYSWVMGEFVSIDTPVEHVQGKAG
jgi:hypothetical protein